MASKNLTRSLKMLFLLVCTFSYLGAFAQIKVTGKVTSNNGAPLAGATILVKDQKGGTTTDVKGNYTLSVANGDATLMFSFIGYQPINVPLNKRSVVNVQMIEDTNVIDELMVVGYGSQRKINVTGSVAQIGRSELKTATSGNLTATLQGRLPGLISKQGSGQPGKDGIDMKIRGINSTAGSGPLIIVDGVPREFPNVTADEIETIAILKDASAAVYGVQASDGVILITTRRGKNVDKKPTITLNSSMSLATITSFPEFLNGPGYAHWYDKAEAMDGKSIEQRRFSREQMNLIINGDPSGFYGNTDWFGELFETGKTFTNSVSVEGGGKDINYFINVGSYNQGGIIGNTSYDRYNVRSNIDARISKRLKMQLGIAGYQSVMKEPGASAGAGELVYGSIFSQAMLSHPYVPMYTPDGQITATFTNENLDNNPLAARDLSGLRNEKKLNIQTNASFFYDVPGIKGLQARFTGAYDRSYQMVKQALTPYKVQALNLALNQYTPRYSKLAQSGITSLNQWFTEQYKYMIQPSIAYDNKFGKHTVSGLFVYEYTNINDGNLSAGVKDFPINTLLEMRFGETVIKELVKGNNTTGKRAGYVTRLNYNYDNKYMFEFTGRIDGTPYLPKANRWGFFPNVSAGWRISEESFFKDNVSFVDNLKVRASYGKLGSEAGLGYDYFGTANLSKDPVAVLGSSPVRALVPGGIFNPNLRWATTTKYNFGAETDMWKGLLGVEFDVFYEKTTDIITSISNTVAQSVGGYYTSKFNHDKVDNRGFELVLSHQNNVGEFSYSVRGNVSWARNKILKTNESINAPSGLRSTGKSIGRKLGLIANGLFQTEEEIANSPIYGDQGATLPGHIRLVDLNGDGKIDWTQDRTTIGRSNTPEMMFGLNFNASWKGFDLNMFFQGAALCDVAICGYYSDSKRGFNDDTFYSRPFYSDGNTPRYLVEGSWTEENRNAKYPRLGIAMPNNGGKLSSWWVKDGSYVRLKSAQIGYNLPESLLKKVNIEKIRVFVTGNNLFTLSHLPFLDPEMPDTNQGYYPQTRVFEFGLTLTF